MLFSYHRLMIVFFAGLFILIHSKINSDSIKAKKPKEIGLTIYLIKYKISIIY
ncbi:exported protein of unknown function [Tepidanaerobacter acetatoxydans Re1]|uniref:Uncharacterized protein n=1 Tax=Tepidanaerobacter acetatoxydans (strain DSM 21804 / JCM 16047 / Re1) TaxID=1209989 RepID=U4QJA9_TEPAE|nr:exported protein of unknown function [Tepidanaerobacter acetatoxydans Re1]